MTPVLGYRRIVTSLSDAWRDAARIRDRELETKLRDLQAITINRLYAVLDHARPGPGGKAARKGRALSCARRRLSPSAGSNFISSKVLEV